MEATIDDIGLLQRIRPPWLANSGLEDCALPPDSIKEAFLRAAVAVKSRVFSADESEGECINNLFPGEASSAPADEIVGSKLAREALGACTKEKGGELIGDCYRGADLVGCGVPEGSGDVVVASAEEGGDGRACVEGERGLKVGEKKEGEEGALHVERFFGPVHSAH